MDPIGTLGGSSTAVTDSAVMQGLGGLDGEAFMTLLVTQLRYQDPLAPTDTEGLLQNTSMLAQTEMLTKVSQMQQQLLGLQRATMATDLIGQQVEGLTPEGGVVAGTVDAVTFVASGPVLVIDGRELALDDVTRFGEREAAPVGGADAVTPTTTDPWTPTPTPATPATVTSAPFEPPVGAPLTFSIRTPAGTPLAITLDEGTRAAEAVGRIRAALAAAGDASLLVSTLDDLRGPLAFTSAGTGSDTRFTISGFGPDLDGTHTGADPTPTRSTTTDTDPSADGPATGTRVTT